LVEKKNFKPRRFKAFKSNQARCKNKKILPFKCKYLAKNAIEVSKISSRHYCTSLVQDLIVIYTKETFNSKFFFSLCNTNGSFEWNLMKKRPRDFRS